MTAVNNSATLVTRAGKGTPLSNTEGDDNFLSLDDTKLSVSAPVVLGPLTIQEVLEVEIEKTGATGVVTHDFNAGAIWHHTGIVSNFTFNLINFPTTIKTATTPISTFAAEVTLILTQGATGFFPNAVQINGAAQTPLRWANNTVPTPTSSAGNIDIVTFTILSTASSVFAVMGQLQAFA